MYDADAQATKTEALAAGLHKAAIDARSAYAMAESRVVVAAAERKEAAAALEASASDVRDVEQRLTAVLKTYESRLTALTDFDASLNKEKDAAAKLMGSIAKQESLHAEAAAVAAASRANARKVREAFPVGAALWTRE